MESNPYESPEQAESTKPVEKLPIGWIAFQFIMMIVAVLIYIVWIPYLKSQYGSYGIELPMASRHLLDNSSIYLRFGILVASVMFVLMLKHRKRGVLRKSRSWATCFIVFWILFLAYSAVVAYAPVFAMRNGGVDIWL